MRSKFQTAPKSAKKIRSFAFANGCICSKAADDETDSVYRNYYDYKEPVKKIAGHRVLAVNRGEKEGFFKGYG